MPKKRKYPWYAARECYRVQRSLPDRSVRTLYAKTEAEMDAKLAELEKEIAAGVDAKINPTVAQYAARWFPLRTSGLSPARKEDYRNAINIHIGPYIAGKKMKEVTSADGREIMAALAERYGVPCQVSLEERMGCGVGACLVCACKTADGRMKHVCKDGPVFDSREVDWND